MASSSAIGWVTLSSLNSPLSPSGASACCTAATSFVVAEVSSGAAAEVGEEVDVEAWEVGDAGTSEGVGPSAFEHALTIRPTAATHVIRITMTLVVRVWLVA